MRLVADELRAGFAEDSPSVPEVYLRSASDVRAPSGNVRSVVAPVAVTGSGKGVNAKPVDDLESVLGVDVQM